MENEESKRNVSEKWINNNIYEALEDIETHQRRMRNGCADILEYLQVMNIGIHKLPEIQLQNMKLMIEEFEILKDNVKDLLTKEQYEFVERKIKLCKKMLHKGLKKGTRYIKAYSFVRVSPDIRKGKVIVLTPLFDIIVNELVALRAKMVKNLSHILYSKSKAERKKEI